MSSEPWNKCGRLSKTKEILRFIPLFAAFLCPFLLGWLNLPSEITASGYYSEKMIYDDNNNIIGRIVTTPTEKLKYTYTYNSDGTFVETTESLENEFSTNLYNNETTLFADDDPDRLITSRS